MKAVNKNIIREILNTKNRFLSIFTICAIGVGFFSGVRATPDDMTMSADMYYDERRLFDLRVVSTFGLTDDDAQAIAQLDGVDEVYPSKYTDLAMLNGDDEYLTRVYSYSERVNILDITDGRAPQAEDECIVSFNRLFEGVKIGDKVAFSDITNTEEFPIKYKEYTVVGLCETPQYISITQRGSTNIGDGKLDAFAYISKSNFTQEVYTEIYIKSDKLEAMQSYSDEYEALRDEISDKLEQLGRERSPIRYDEVVGEALTEIADGEAELEKAKKEGAEELENAREELSDAERQISENEEKLADAKKELADGEAQLNDAKAELDSAFEELNDGQKELDENREKLEAAERELADAASEIAQGQAELDNAKKTLDETKVQLDAGYAQLESSRAEISDKKAQIALAEQQLAAGKAQYAEGLAEYEQGMAQYNAAAEKLQQAEQALKQAEAIYGKDNPLVVQQRVELEAGKAALAESYAKLKAAEQVLGETKAQIDAAEKEIADGKAQLEAGEAQLNEAQAQLDSGKAQYDGGVLEYEQAKAEFDKGKAEYEAGLAEYESGKAELSAGEKKLSDGWSEYNSAKALFDEKAADFESGKQEMLDGEEKLADAKQQYQDGLREYEDGLQTYYREIADAESELADARQKIIDAGEAKWYIFLRDDNVGYAEYKSNAERIGKIASIFPVFFLLVAALVCLTTMSRMVEEQRTMIGTFKALGYSDGVVMRHYMTYALTAAISGGLIGAFFGCFLFPKIIIFTYSIMYSISDVYYKLSPLNIGISVGSMALTIAATVFFSCRKALGETAAELMRPKAPKSGKRVLLERIGFIWNRLGFFGKVTARNIFRYKRRMLMTIIGIAGCTALSLTGFGLKDSIKDIVNLQYNNIYKYSGYIAVEDNLSDEQLSGIYLELNNYNPETETTRALLKQYTVTNNSANAQCYIAAVENPVVFSDMVSMHERVSKKEISMMDGAVVTEKLAKLLGAKVGDTITVQIDDSTTSALTVSAITEQYASHYIYVTEELYTEVFGYAPEYNMVYFNNGLSDDKEQQEVFSEKMLGTDGVLAVMLNSGASESFAEMVKMMDLVVLVLIVSAGALAFVVLYNLTNVNITERIREIATLKVLGFYDREVSSYVFRENIILSLFGAGAGLLVGVALCRFIVVTAEIDEVMFGRQIHPLSFILSFVITVAFSLIVNLIMTGVLKKISMVESLKSVE